MTRHWCVGWVDAKGGVEMARVGPKGELLIDWVAPEDDVQTWWSFTKENPLRLSIEASGDFTVPDAVVAMVLDADASLDLLVGCKVASKFKAVYLEEGTPFKFKLREGLIKWLKGGGIKIAPYDEDQ